MAISPLALGIGLQGKYDYRQQAALEMSRQKGRAKAEADEAAALAKKLAPIERRLMRVTGEGLLPVHQELAKKKVAEAIDYMMDNQGDYAGVTQRLYDVESFIQSAKGQYNSHQKSQFGNNVAGNTEALRIIGTLRDPKEITNALAGVPGSTINFDEQSNNFTFDAIDYKPTSVNIDNAIKAGGQSYFDVTGKETIVTVGEKKYTMLGIDPLLPNVIKSDIMNNRDRYVSATNDYAQYLSVNNQKLPNLRTEEGMKEFKDGVSRFVDQQIVDDLSRRNLIKNITPTKGNTQLTISVGDNKDGEIGAATQTEVLLKYSGQRATDAFSATSLGFLPTLGNFNLTFPTSQSTFDHETGEKLKEATVLNGTYNGADAYYVAKDDIVIPGKFFGAFDGVGYTPGVTIKKGQIVDDNYIEEAKKQKKLDAAFVVFGKTNEKFPRSIYRLYSEAGILPILQMSNSNRAIINSEWEKASGRIRQLKSELGNLNPQPKSTPAQNNPPPAPAKKAEQKTPPTPPKAPSNQRRTPEAQAAKDALKKKLNEGK